LGIFENSFVGQKAQNTLFGPEREYERGNQWDKEIERSDDNPQPGPKM
jgi:hypothetical protein